MHKNLPGNIITAFTSILWTCKASSAGAGKLGDPVAFYEDTPQGQRKAELRAQQLAKEDAIRELIEAQEAEKLEAYRGQTKALVFEHHGLCAGMVYTGAHWSWLQLLLIA